MTDNELCLQLRSALGLPEGICIYRVHFGDIGPTDLTLLSLPPELGAASRKRRRDFLAGRYCAIRALKHAGCNVATDIPVGTDGLPKWPVGWLGSISHGDQMAVASVCRKSAFDAIGIDTENCIDEASIPDVQHHIACPEELALLRKQLSLNRALTLLFSAKEALYKALYPSTRRFVDFTAARAVLVTPDRLHLRLCQDWSAQWREGTSLQIHYAWHDAQVFTVLYLQSSPDIGLPSSGAESFCKTPIATRNDHH